MRKAPYILLGIALWLATAIMPMRGREVHAQTSSLPACNGTSVASPMQGRYTGPWHSDGDYHFAVFNTDLDLTITIDGTLDVTVSPQGQVSGVARGTVDAPIHHDGIRDVSSGTGTISGLIQGVVTPSGAALTLVQPVIAMQWGTFIPNGYTVPRSITMPDYQFPSMGADCVSFHGSISEQNFPTQFVVNDGGSGLTQAPGIGAASGAWSLSHTESADFSQLSQQVDTFTAQADAALSPSSSPLTASAFNSSVLQPFETLLASIHQHPDIARCLLERLNAWVARTVPALRSQSQGLVQSSELVSLRGASDLARAATSLQRECLVPDDGTVQVISNKEITALDGAVLTRNWSAAALDARESTLTSGDSVNSWQHFTGDLHQLLQTPLPSSDKLDVARVAYALGDDVDAASVIPAHARVEAFQSRAVSGAPKKKHKKKKSPAKPVPTRTATPTPRPTATFTPTPTPAPMSLAATLQAGVSKVTARTDSAPIPSFSWSPVAGATTYIVFVTGSSPAALLWSWSGSDTTAHYGDSALSGVPGSAGEVWPITLTSTAYTWSVLALGADGHVVGEALRIPA